MPKAAKRRKQRDVTTITSRGQTVIPARLRKMLGMREGSKVVWVAGIDYLMVTLMPDDPIEAVAGKYRGKGPTVADLLAARRADRAREAR